MNDLPKRKQIRLKDYDYSQNGYYFVTICTKGRKSLLWNAVLPAHIRPNDENKDIYLSYYGKIVNTAINRIPLYYANVKIDKYIIMPNHIHLILVISNNDENGRIISAPTKSVPVIIGQMKRWVSKKIGFSMWQKSYFEHIIRNKTDYIETAQYIMNNPLNPRLWNE